ncbi:hypothetical protein BsWGS_16378 [Bradybaena similaris]
MAEIISMLILLFSMGWALSLEPGVKIAVTNKGLEYASQVAGAALRSKLQAVTIPDQSGSEGSKSLSVSNIRIKSITGPDTHVSLNPGAGGVTLALSNFGIHLHADWRAKKRIIFKLSIRGSVELTVSGASVTVVAALGEKNGRPSVTGKSCSCRIDDVGLKLRGGLAAFILNLFKGVIRKKIRNTLQVKVCEAVMEQVNTRANAELARMKVSGEIARRFTVDYSLTRPPTITDNHIEVASRGLVYWKDNRQLSPFRPAALPALTDFSNMLYLYVTEYSANTLAYVAHVNGLLKYNFTLDSLSIDGSDLQNNVEQLKVINPHSKLELRISSSSAPSVKFENQKMTTAAAANVDVVVHTNNQAVTPLGLRVNLSLTVQPSIVDEKLIAIIASYTFHTEVIKSDIGHINGQDFNALIRKEMDAVVIPELNDLMEEGVELPTTGTFHLFNTKLNLQPGYLQVATDLEYLRESVSATTRSSRNPHYFPFHWKNAHGNRHPFNRYIAH